jgi:hypothetical protein
VRLVGRLPRKSWLSWKENTWVGLSGCDNPPCIGFGYFDPQSTSISSFDLQFSLSSKMFAAVISVSEL